MNPEPADWARLIETVEALRNEVSRLGGRLAALESAAAGATRAAAPPATAPVRQTEKLDEELILTIGAAVAAFLGKRAHVRQIRLVGSAAWAQQSRVTIQASHALAARHGT